MGLLCVAFCDLDKLRVDERGRRLRHEPMCNQSYLVSRIVVTRAMKVDDSVLVRDREAVEDPNSIMLCEFAGIVDKA